VLATPDLLENRLEYERRVVESWFALSGVDPALPGPLTDPGQALLRFGRPDEWISNSGVGAAGFETLGNDFGINRTWAFRYDVPGAAGGRPLWIVFQDHGSAARFTAVDSMVAPRFPPCFFPQSFAGRAYRYESAATRLRQPDGRTLLLLCYDTLLPDYAVRFPLQGLRFDGSAEVRAALYRPRGNGWQARAQQAVVLDREHAISDQWSFRRRSGSAVIADLEAGGARLASRLLLRDAAGSIVGYAVDNGEDGRLDRFSGESLHASDLLFICPFEKALAEVPDRESRAGWKTHGPDLLAGGLEPRASRLFLPGEPIAFYLEVYGLRLRRGLSDAEVTTTLERLRPDGTEDYSITTEGLTQSLVQFEIRQWNVARSLGLTHLQPGYYRLRIGVLDSNADLALERTLVFRVATPDEIAELYAWDRIRPPEPGGPSPSGDLPGLR
jgi:hypothetical protein